MTSDEAAIRQEILQLIGAYTYFGDSGQVERFAELFADDGVLQVADHTSTGPAEILAYAKDVGGRFGDSAGFLPARHHVSSHYIEVLDAEHAKARSYFQLVSALGPDHWGRYKDDFVRRDGRWLFASRHAVVEGKAELLESGPARTGMLPA